MYIVESNVPEADLQYQPIPIVHAHNVIVRQMDAPIQPILVYHKFPIDNRQNALFHLLNIDNWMNITRTST